MSGPIVRKYGFPNFEKIFGERGLQHGADEEPKSSEATAEKTAPGSATNPSPSEKSEDEGKKKSS